MNRYADIQRFTTLNNNLRNKGLRYINVARYGDVTLWWIISTSNPNIVKFNSIFLPIGSQIRIPQDISPIIDSFNELNR